MPSSEDIQKTKDEYELPPLEQTGTCPHCGAPILGRKMFGGWINRECECQRKAREEEERQEAERTSEKVGSRPGSESARLHPSKNGKARARPCRLPGGT